MMTRNQSAECSIQDGNEEEGRQDNNNKKLQHWHSIEDCNKEEGGLDNNDEKLQHRTFYRGWQ